MVKTQRKYLKLKRPVVGRGFVAPNFSRFAFHFMRIAGRAYIKLFEGISSVTLQNADPLIDAFHQFQDGDKRLILAFRHASKMDAPVLMYAISKSQARIARKRGRQLRKTPHVRFLYGKDVLNWAGAAAVWLFPRIGNIPVVNGESNKEGLSLLKEEICSGEFPIALAPEGQVTYHMYQSSPIAQGTAALARWGLDSGKDVTVLPVAIGYHYTDDCNKLVKQVLKRWERLTNQKIDGTLPTGFIKPELQDTSDYSNLYAPLIEATDKTLAQLEDFYHIDRSADDSGNEWLDDFKKRIADICETALKTAESMLNIEGVGDWLSRVFRIRYIGMSNLYPETFNPLFLPPLQRNKADFRSLEARIYIRHSQVVDVLEYLDPSYIFPGCQPQRYCEYALNLLDIINRLMGGDISSRFNPAKIQAYVVPGEPISTKDFYGESGQAAGRRAMQEKFTDHLLQVLSSMSADLDVPQ